ncbi:hypothetical protein ATANTOWER_026173 [Ataeniobius toweri]|uniref:Uncharacterized protein n=1 Tax=Ataeniobius toweri TaxID=208326 RepID=A0ABU7CG80_9TELE|nr:hypothetical protein [Ataeniobius toweri]
MSVLLGQGHYLMYAHSGWNRWHISGHLLSCFLYCFLIDRKQIDCCFCLLQHNKQLEASGISIPLLTRPSTFLFRAALLNALKLESTHSCYWYSVLLVFIRVTEFLA